MPRGLILSVLVCLAITARAQQPARQMEKLDRALIAVPARDGIYLGWRMLGTDPESIAFNIYRNGQRINEEPIIDSTNFIDTDAEVDEQPDYQVAAVVGSEQIEITEPTRPWSQQYLKIPLQIPPPGVTRTGENYRYTANDISVGDLTGDGQYEIVLKWDPTNAKDNSHAGHTGNVYIDAYTLEGSKLWRIDLGQNVRAGAHYTQFMVYDLNGNGRAEVAMRTADGTIDGLQNVIGDIDADWSNRRGYIIEGPEYLTVFDGLTGGEITSTKFYPDRQDVSQWGDNYGNRADRFLAGIAYVDGQRPSLIMARGMYGPRGNLPARNEIAAYNFRESNELEIVWHFKAGLRINDDVNREYIGQGAHSLSITDVTGNGKDDIIYGAAVIKHDGTGLYSTGWGHGDALHVADMDPNRPGLEVFMPHEDMRDSGGRGTTLRDGRTGRLLWSTPGEGDVGRGVAFNVDPRYPGYQMWATNCDNMYNAQGRPIGPRPRSVNFGIWWTGDLLRELLDDIRIEKWDWQNSVARTIFVAHGCTSINGTKATPGLSADILGDWREEVIFPAEDHSHLRIYTTTIPTEHRIYTLMHDPTYRLSIAWQNVAYNQPPHTGFFLGHGMELPAPRPKIYMPQNRNNR